MEPEVDNAKCDAKAVEDIDGVKGVFSASGQLQIILGTGTVNKVYDEFIAISGLTAATKEEVKAAAAVVVHSACSLLIYFSSSRSR